MKPLEHIWEGERPLAAAISMSDINRCPTHRMDAKHYRPDGTCVCVPPRDESLESHIIRGEN